MKIIIYICLVASLGLSGGGPCVVYPEEVIVISHDESSEREQRDAVYYTKVDPLSTLKEFPLPLVQIFESYHVLEDAMEAYHLIDGIRSYGTYVIGKIDIGVLWMFRAVLPPRREVVVLTYYDDAEWDVLRSQARTRGTIYPAIQERLSGERVMVVGSGEKMRLERRGTFFSQVPVPK